MDAIMTEHYLILVLSHRLYTTVLKLGAPKQYVGVAYARIVRCTATSLASQDRFTFGKMESVVERIFALFLYVRSVFTNYQSCTDR